MKSTTPLRCCATIIEIATVAIVVSVLAVFVVPVIDEAHGSAEQQAAIQNSLAAHEPTVDLNADGDVIAFQVLLSDFSDGDLAVVSQIPTLETLDLWLCPKITDAGLQSLCGAAGLKTLQIDSKLVTVDGIEFIGQIVSLEELILAGVPVNDAGVAALGNLTNLNTLSLEGAHITDASLETLAWLPNLKHLILVKTDVSEQALKRFRHARPDCRVFI